MWHNKHTRFLINRLTVCLPCMSGLGLSCLPGRPVVEALFPAHSRPQHTNTQCVCQSTVHVCAWLSMLCHVVVVAVLLVHRQNPLVSVVLTPFYAHASGHIIWCNCLFCFLFGFPVLYNGVCGLQCILQQVCILRWRALYSCPCNTSVGAMDAFRRPRYHTGMLARPV